MLTNSTHGRGGQTLELSRCLRKERENWRRFVIAESDEDLFVRRFLRDLRELGGDEVAANRAIRSGLAGMVEAWADLYAIVAACASNLTGDSAARLQSFLIENSDLAAHDG